MRSPVTPKKRLGQHFLTDLNIARKIVESLPLTGVDQVLEVGPGTGVLTRYLKELPLSLKLSEVDAESIAYLAEHMGFTQADHVGDFLRLRLPDLQGQQVAVIGNFPYNISSQIFFQVLDFRDQVPACVGMLQKEVAERICSPHGNKVYGILSVLLQAYYETRYLFTVEPGVFNPPPKVRSAVIRLVRRAEAPDVPYDVFKKIVKLAFGVRRKTLRNALKSLNLPPEITTQPVFDLRAEQLSVSDFIELVKQLHRAGRSH